MIHQVHCSDALTFLRNMEDASVDLVVADPPYTALDAHRAIGTTTRLHAKGWFPTLSDEQIGLVLDECFRVLKPRTHAYVMCSYAGVWGLKPRVEQAGFQVPKSLIWDKVAIGMGYSYRAQHEHIIFGRKGKRPVNNRGIGDVLRVKRVYSGHQTWPTEKPVDLMQILIEQSTHAGEVVLDPFCGSGVTGEAALRWGRQFIGLDVDERAVNLTRKRLERLEEET